jgi:hypothetical protein
MQRGDRRGRHRLRHGRGSRSHGRPRPPASQHSVSTSASTPSPTPRANIEARGGPPSERTPPTSMSSSRFTDAALAAFARREASWRARPRTPDPSASPPARRPGAKVCPERVRRKRERTSRGCPSRPALWVVGGRPIGSRQPVHAHVVAHGADRPSCGAMGRRARRARRQRPSR